MDFSNDQQFYYGPFSKILFKAEIELKGRIFLIKDHRNMGLFKNIFSIPKFMWTYEGIFYSRTELARIYLRIFPHGL